MWAAAAPAQPRSPRGFQLTFWFFSVLRLWVTPPKPPQLWGLHLLTTTSPSLTAGIWFTPSSLQNDLNLSARHRPALRPPFPCFHARFSDTSICFGARASSDSSSHLSALLFQLWLKGSCVETLKPDWMAFSQVSGSPQTEFDCFF